MKVQWDGEDFAPVESSWERDSGLVVRGPNPFVEGHLVTILAGCRSTGTEAACRGATDVRLLRAIQDRGCNLDDHERPFYAVVVMERHGPDQHFRANEETMAVLDAGNFEPVPRR